VIHKNDSAYTKKCRKDPGRKLATLDRYIAEKRHDEENVKEGKSYVNIHHLV
jgi:hypothetical protein